MGGVGYPPLSKKEKIIDRILYTIIFGLLLAAVGSCTVPIVEHILYSKDFANCSRLFYSNE